jgi:hypothetical protein
LTAATGVDRVGAGIGFSDYGHLAGTRFATGEFRLQPHHSWLWADAARSDPDVATVHPGVAYMVAMRGGASIAAVMELLETPAERTLLGELGFEFGEVPMRPGITYAVSSELTAVERKRGRRMPVFDRVTLVHRIAERHGGGAVATVTQVWVVARVETAT